MIELTRRQTRRLKNKHAGLRAEVIKTGWWIFGSKEYEVRCSCGWVSPKRIPILPPEISMTTDYLVRITMERHIEDVLNRKDF